MRTYTFTPAQQKQVAANKAAVDNATATLMTARLKHVDFMLNAAGIKTGKGRINPCLTLKKDGKSVVIGS